MLIPVGYFKHYKNSLNQTTAFSNLTCDALWRNEEKFSKLNDVLSAHP
ncbi:hypothetical protein HQ393_09690 [Chitinibacter bivalviorum]|uniref:Uncharacterized protein n=1 Tax=Chitinibacter bivalviorum TaxID=2739434 RepID=A0A7H9BIM4_9NEIS|nr:hypothetical protein [Chitinibacter bivalviorum]QLG88497.1 hypothetical protein HQ393_09690 [Chitinibacter bivalviorum]